MNKAKGEFRKLQLRCLGIIAIVIGPLCAFIVSGIHGLPFPESISETATTGNVASYILPFCLGALSLFAFTYSIIYAYDDKLDRILTLLMGVGFCLVATNPTWSHYVSEPKVGIFGIDISLSTQFHNIGAVVGFGSMILWILLCFKKSNKTKVRQTAEKQKRNSIYTVLGWCMIGSLGLFVIYWIGLLSPEFAIVYWVEVIMLTFGGIACLIKGGVGFVDKPLPPKATNSDKN